MNSDGYEESLSDELVFNAVRFAREQITALPTELQATAFDMLAASLQREIGPQARYLAHASGSYPARLVRRSPRRSWRR